MDDSARRALTEILARSRDEIIDRGTDWLREQSADLGAGRPRDETRRLVEGVVEAQATALLQADEGPLLEFVDFVTSFRASSGFHLSTILRGLLAFRRGIEPVLRREIADGWVAAALLQAIDHVGDRVVFRAADFYDDKLNHALLGQREELEEELRQVTAAKERELDEKLGTIDGQRLMLNVLASPVLQVWKGVLVVPLIGVLDDLRAEAVRERVLNAVVTTRSQVVLVDITGLSVTDEQLAAELLRLVACVRLLGADAMLVGVSPEGARALARLDVKLDRMRSFSTLDDGLRDALRRVGLRVTRA